MHVAQFFNALVIAKGVEVVIAGLPERCSCLKVHAPGNRLSHRLNCSGKHPAFGFAHQEVDVFGHDDVSDHEETVAAARGLKRRFKHVADLWSY